MTTDLLVFASELWNQAVWRGLAFNYRDGHDPLVALVFENGEAGRSVLDALMRFAGLGNSFDVIRLAFIEGDIPGERAGYTVHLGVDPQRIRAKANHEGTELPEGIVATSRWQRIYGGGLAKFKEAYGKSGKCLLGAAELSSRTIYFDLTIPITNVAFRSVNDIQKGEIDEAIFVKERRATVN